MTVSFRIRRNQLDRIRTDLRRPHIFALERMGFIMAHVGALPDNGLAILAYDYMPVDDEDYVDDPSVAAMMGSAAIRKALQVAYLAKAAIFHVHEHSHSGAPWFSRTDLRESARFVPNFFHVAPHLPHGAIVLSSDAIAGKVWRTKHSKPRRIPEIVEIGAPLRFFWSH